MSRIADEPQKSDGELLKAATEGNESAFWQFCVRSLPTLLRVVRLRCRYAGVSLDLAQDAAQEAIVRAVKWLREHPGTQLSLGWLIKTATNLVFDWGREKIRQGQYVDKTRHNAAYDESHPAQDASDVLAAFESLSADDREILELVLLDGYTPKKASEILGINLWTTYKRYERALSRLRARVASR